MDGLTRNFQSCSTHAELRAFADSDGNHEAQAAGWNTPTWPILKCVRLRVIACSSLSTLPRRLSAVIDHGMGAQGLLPRNQHRHILDHRHVASSRYRDGAKCC
jgi:hypothetical protein